MYIKLPSYLINCISSLLMRLPYPACCGAEIYRSKNHQLLPVEEIVAQYCYC